MYEVEGVINTMESCVHFSNRSILQPREQRFIWIEMWFIGEISRLAVIKLLDFKTGNTNILNGTFVRHFQFVDVTNNLSEQLIFSKDEALGILDLISICYYKVKQSIMWHPLKTYTFRQSQVLCEEFNKLTNTLRREGQQSTDP